LALFTSATKTMRGIQHLGGNVLTEPAAALKNPNELLDDLRKQLIERETIERSAAGGRARRGDAEANAPRGMGGVSTEDMYAIAERWANKNEIRRLFT
jgi:hypothetical protein